MLWPAAASRVVAAAATLPTTLLPTSYPSSCSSSSSSSLPSLFLRRFYRHGAIVNLAVVLQLVAAALPPGAEDEIVLIEHLPGRQVHLQDFFWTGVEDAPPWLSNDQMLTLYDHHHHHHHTATVYVPAIDESGTRQPEPPPPPSGPAIDCASCPTIEPTPTLLHEVDQDIGVLVGDDPGPRYWLLTVLKPGEGVPSKIELRLARLYKAAFARQQQRHLGLLGSDYRAQRIFPKRQIISENQTLVSQMTELSSLKESSSSNNEQQQQQRPPSPRETSRFGRSLLQMRPVRIVRNKQTLPIIADTAVSSALVAEGGNFYDVNNNNDTRQQQQQQRPASVDVGLVQVRMQNTSQTESGATRLIYTVHLGGKPVPAETAAKDMALLSAQEVALELGAPVIIQSEPYLKESRPLALSRKRDAWLLIGAAGAGVLLLCAILLGLLIFTKRKRAQSSVAIPPKRRILAKDVEEYGNSGTPGIDNTAYTSENEARTEPTSGRKRATPGTLSRTPGSQDTLEADQLRDAMVSENELANEQRRGQAPAKMWDTREYAEAAKKGMLSRSRTTQRADAIDRPRSLESPDSAVGGEGRLESLESLDKGFDGEAEENLPTGSPHSYLSMPSCKQFPNMRSVEPLSKVLEPVVVKHLDVELDSPDMKPKRYSFGKGNGEFYFQRSASEYKDPGVLGPIVWDLKRNGLLEGDFELATATAAATTTTSAPTEASTEPADLESSRLDLDSAGAVVRARCRLSQLIEDSLGRLSSRESESRRDYQQQQPHFQHRRASHGEGGNQDHFPAHAENRGKSAHVRPVAVTSAVGASRPRTSLPRNGETDSSIPETGRFGPQPRGAWGSRPLSAGPFHRPNLPEVEVARVLADQPLRPEDPAVPLITSIKKELGKFSH